MIIAGILLGPTFLGQIPLGEGRHLGTTLFPTEVRPSLSTLAISASSSSCSSVGLELNLTLIRGNGRRAGGDLGRVRRLPFCLGLLLATGLYDDHKTGKPFASFALFIGASMSVTAFPVLARILSERRMLRTRSESWSSPAAAVDDVLAWSMLAAVTAVAEGTGPGDTLRTFIAAAAFAVFMLRVVRRRSAISPCCTTRPAGSPRTCSPCC